MRFRSHTHSRRCFICSSCVTFILYYVFNIILSFFLLCYLCEINVPLSISIAVVVFQLQNTWRKSSIKFVSPSLSLLWCHNNKVKPKLWPTGLSFFTFCCCFVCFKAVGSGQGAERHGWSLVKCHRNENSIKPLQQYTDTLLLDKCVWVEGLLVTIKCWLEPM